MTLVPAQAGASDSRKHARSMVISQRGIAATSQTLASQAALSAAAASISNQSGAIKAGQALTLEAAQRLDNQGGTIGAVGSCSVCHFSVRPSSEKSPRLQLSEPSPASSRWVNLVLAAEPSNEATS